MKRTEVKIAWTFAAGFLGATALGFIPNPLVGDGAIFVTNTAHNLVHLATAIGFASVAWLGSKASVRFMQVFGAVYMLVGLIGFVALGSASETHLLGLVHINLLDNFLHVGLGIVISAAGWWSQGRLWQTEAALEGYDPVAYFTDGKPVRGSAELFSQYGQQTYHFASSKHKAAFDRQPDAYLPQYGGYCAFGMAMGQRFDVDPQTGQVIDGKLYLNLNRNILDEFNKDAEGYIEKADQHWDHDTTAVAA